MTGINVTNKKSRVGRNKVPHTTRKYPMPPENQGEHDRVMDLPRGEPLAVRKYSIRVNGKVVYEPPEEYRKKKGESGPAYFENNFKDDVVKGRWV